MPLIKTILDWETAYGVHPETGEDITLSKMTTEEYVRHPGFKVHGLGVKIQDEAPFYLYKPADLVHFLKTHPWHNSWVVAHHAHFDGAILSWRAGVRPAFWGDTLSMARAVFPHESHSLNNLAKLLGAGEKGIELQSVKGKWCLTEEEQQILGGYCINDVALTARIFDRLRPHFPLPELRLIDLTVRLFTEPVLEVEPIVLIEDFKREKRTKRALIKQCAGSKDTLASNDKFAELLLTLGIDPPKKLSPSKVKDGRVDPDHAGEPPLGLLPSFKAPKGATKEEREALKTEKNAYPWAYAFGKGDEAFKLLLDHPDPQVSAVVEARMGVKSTIKETRAKRFWKIGSRGAFPVYHNYYGARTGRDCLSGDTSIYVLRGGKVCSILLPQLRPDDLVWDGGEFVTHGGLLAKGELEVITYGGITGTPDHRVYTNEEPEAVELRVAAERGYTLKVGAPPPEHEPGSPHPAE